jgi:hypothetical protein
MGASPNPFQILILLHLKFEQKEKFNIKEIIVITGASSGFGALTARFGKGRLHCLRKHARDPGS